MQLEEPPSGSVNKSLLLLFANQPNQLKSGMKYACASADRVPLSSKWYIQHSKLVLR